MKKRETDREGGKESEKRNTFEMQLDMHIDVETNL